MYCRSIYNSSLYYRSIHTFSSLFCITSQHSYGGGPTRFRVVYPTSERRQVLVTHCTKPKMESAFEQEVCGDTDGQISSSDWGTQVIQSSTQEREPEWVRRCTADNLHCGCGLSSTEHLDVSGFLVCTDLLIRAAASTESKYVQRLLHAVGTREHTTRHRWED